MQIGSVLQTLRTNAKMTVCKVLEQTAPRSCTIDHTSGTKDALAESSATDSNLPMPPSETTASDTMESETVVINLPSAEWRTLHFDPNCLKKLASQENKDPILGDCISPRQRCFCLLISVATRIVSLK
jgi:hypothetical protein